MDVSDWDDVSDHHDFMKSDSYKDFFVEVAAVFDLDRGAPALTHANYASHPPNGPREAPVTEFACFALPTSAGNEQKSALEDAVLNLATACSRAGSCTSFATGWVVEHLDHDNGTDGKALPNRPGHPSACVVRPVQSTAPNPFWCQSERPRSCHSIDDTNPSNFIRERTENGTDLK